MGACGHGNVQRRPIMAEGSPRRLGSDAEIDGADEASGGGAGVVRDDVRLRQQGPAPPRRVPRFEA